MHYPNFDALITDSRRTLAKGPVALVLIEDDVEVHSTLMHLDKLGFGNIVAFCAPDLSLPETDLHNLHVVDFDVTADNALAYIVNSLIKALPETWFHDCYNAEYLHYHYPFCEHRNIREMLGFMQEEQRDSVMSFILEPDLKVVE